METENLSKEHIEQLRKNAEFRVELADCLKRLQNNPDFIKLTSYYFNNEPIRLVHLLADPAWCEESKRNLVIQQMYGVAQLNLFLQFVKAQGETEKKTLEDLDNLDNSNVGTEETVQ